MKPAPDRRDPIAIDMDPEGANQIEELSYMLELCQDGAFAAAPRSFGAQL